MSNISEDKDFELDSNRIRRHFPLINNRNIAYLDNGATTQKPMQVLEAMNNYYENNNANPFRGVYELSVDATDAYERARVRVKLKNLSMLDIEKKLYLQEMLQKVST